MPRLGELASYDIGAGVIIGGLVALVAGVAGAAHTVAAGISMARDDAP